MEFEEEFRKHGLECPLNFFQIASWIVFLYEILTAYLIFIPPLSLALKCVFGVFVSIGLILVSYFAFKASINDPTDEIVYQEKEARQKKQKFESTLKHYCIICNSHVHQRTKHCGQCNRCVDNFDHHCVWLNNCVGKSNYKTITSLFFESAFKLAFSIYLIVKYHFDTEEFNFNASEYYGEYKEYPILAIFLYISVGVNFFLTAFVFELTLLHLWLMKQGITTYEYILQKRERQQNKSNSPKKERKSKTIKRIEDISNTQQSGMNSQVQSDISQLRLINKGSLDHSSTLTENKEDKEAASRNGSSSLFNNLKDLGLTDMSQIHTYKNTTDIHDSPNKDRTSDNFDVSFDKSRLEHHAVEESKEPEQEKQKNPLEKLPQIPERVLNSNFGKVLMMGTGIDLTNSGKDAILSPKTLEENGMIIRASNQNYRSIEGNTVQIGSKSDFPPLDPKSKKAVLKKQLDTNTNNPNTANNQPKLERNPSNNSINSSQTVERQDFTLGSHRSFGRRDDTGIFNGSNIIRNDL